MKTFTTNLLSNGHSTERRVALVVVVAAIVVLALLGHA